MAVESCPFCRIAAGKAPATILQQDEHILAFRDSRPMAPIHILIAPVSHLSSINEAATSDAALLGDMLLLARQIAERVGVDRSGYRLVINTGPEAGQTVHHLHMHLLAGRPMRWPPG